VLADSATESIGTIVGVDRGDLGVWDKIARGSQKLKNDLRRQEEAREREAWRGGPKRDRRIGPILTKEDLKDFF
jgi:hypothetical protein